jgi:ATP-binding cassette subfamily B protein RaxB
MQYQTEAAECGLACLAMILSFHGKRTDVSALRQAWPMSMKGLTFTQLIEIAGDMGLNARPVRLELYDLKKLQVPCVLHWRLDHFVVLARVTSGYVEILDPAIGRRRLPLAETSKSFSGAALELRPASSFDQQPATSKLELSRFFADTRGLGRALLQLLLLSLALQLFVLVTPFYSQVVIDDIVISGDLDLLLLCAVAFSGLATFTAVTSGFRSWVIIYMSSALNLSWSSALFHHLLRLPCDYFEKRHIGDIQSRFASLNAIRDLVTRQVVEVVIDGAMALTTAIVMYLYSPTLAGIVLSSVLIYLLVQWSLFGRLRGASLELLVRTATRETYFLETIRGILAIKNFGNESYRKAGYENRVAESVAAAADVGRIRVWGEVANMLVFGLLNVLLIWFAARAIVSGTFTVGMMVAFLAYKIHFVGRSAALVDKLFQFRLARIHLDRIADIVDAVPEKAAGLTSGASTFDPGVASGRIEARDIWYRYGRNEPYVISGLNLCIAPGEHVAIAGPSGSGKSTLLKVLIGLTAPERGEVLVDGRPLRTIDLRSYRQTIGVVMQSDDLLSGTLLNNITFFSSQPDVEKVDECCRLAGLEDDIAAMPMGYYTLVGDMGDVLSGGQKQRLLLARALYRSPKILFLDEATSHLDANQEKHLVREIAALNITRIVVAHRHETLRHADRVIAISEPRG